MTTLDHGVNGDLSGDYPQLRMSGRKRMMGGKGQRCGGDEDGTDAGQEDVGTVAVDPQAAFAAQAAQPADGVAGPSDAEVVDEERREQDEDEEPSHAFACLDTHILDIQAILLVEAVGMFDPRAVAPVGIDGVGVSSGTDGDRGEQHEVAIQVGVVGDEGPEEPCLPRQAQLEPADLDGHGALTPGVLEGHAHAEAPGHGGDEGLQAPWLPPVETVVEDLHDPVQMTGPDDELSRGLAHLAEELLIIQPAVRHETQPPAGKPSPRLLNRPPEFPVLAQEILGLVREPAGVGDHRHVEVDDGRRAGRIARRQPFLPVRSGRRALHDRGDALQLCGVRLLEVDRVEGHHQIGRIGLFHRLLGDGRQPALQRLMSEAPIRQKTVDPLRQRPDVLLRAGHVAREFRHHGRLAPHDPLDRLRQRPPQAHVGQLISHWREELLQRVLQLRHRQVGNPLPILYLVHGSASAVLGLLQHVQGTTAAGASPTSTDKMWVITSDLFLTH